MSKNKNELDSVYQYIEKLNETSESAQVLLFSKVDKTIYNRLVNLSKIQVDRVSSENYQDVKLTINPLTDLLIITEYELDILNIDLFLNRINFQELMVIEAIKGNKDINYKLQRRGFVKTYHLPIVYQWQNKTEWGTLLLSQQKYLQAILAFKRILQDNPWDVTALTQLGLLSIKLEDFNEAEQLFKKALQRERRNPVLMEKLAQVLIALNQPQKAVEILEYLVIIQSINTSAWLLLERCHRQNGAEDKAIIAYECSRKFNNRNNQIDISTCLWGQPQAKMSPKRILVINNLYPPQELGGYGRRICDFANVLQQRGHTTYTLTSDAPYLGIVKSPEENISRDLILAGTYEKLPSQYYEDHNKVNQIIYHNNQVIRTAIANFKPDICLVGNIDLLSHTVFLPLLEQAIPVIHLLGFEQPGYPVKFTPDSPLYYVAANSEYSRQELFKKNYPLKDIGVVYPGAFINQFQMCCLPSFDRLRIVFASLVLPYKGPQVLLKALAILQKAKIDFHCSIAGDAPHQGFISQLKQFVKEHEIDNKVDFLGYLSRPQLIDLFSTHNVLVFPTVEQEPFGRSQVEAMAAGLTLVTSGTGGAGEVIEPNITGLLFETENHEALAEKLMSLVDNPEIWQQITIAGIEKAKQFDINRSIDFIENKFNQLLQLRDGNEQLLQQKIQAELKQNLRLREINYIIFPDWQASEELLGLSIAEVFRGLMNHPDGQKMTLLIDTHDISDEDADTVISSIVMSLMMEEELEIEDAMEVTLVGELDDQQWVALLPLLQGRIVLDCDNIEAIAQAKVESLETIKLKSFR